jgi:hypothetical protein
MTYENLLHELEKIDLLLRENKTVQAYIWLESLARRVSALHDENPQSKLGN